MTIADNRTRWFALFVLCLGNLMIVLDTTIVNVALPSIRQDLGFSEASLAWVVNAYLLTFGGFLLLSGRLAGVPGGGARGAGPRRRGRGGGGAVADHDAVHRAGRARQGDGRDRLRRRRRREHRRAARRRADRPARLALGLSRQRPDRRGCGRALAGPAPG